MLSPRQSRFTLLEPLFCNLALPTLAGFPWCSVNSAHPSAIALWLAHCWVSKRWKGWLDEFGDGCLTNAEVHRSGCGKHCSSFAVEDLLWLLLWLAIGSAGAKAYFRAGRTKKHLKIGRGNEELWRWVHRRPSSCVLEAEFGAGTVLCAPWVAALALNTQSEQLDYNLRWNYL